MFSLIQRWVGPLFAVGQAHDGFAVVGRQLGRHEGGVAHDVVDERQAQGAGVADVIKIGRAHV